jgi:hypothetical protein
VRSQSVIGLDTLSRFGIRRRTVFLVSFLVDFCRYFFADVVIHLKQSYCAAFADLASRRAYIIVKLHDSFVIGFDDGAAAKRAFDEYVGVGEYKYGSFDFLFHQIPASGVIKPTRFRSGMVIHRFHKEGASTVERLKIHLNPL